MSKNGLLPLQGVTPCNISRIGKELLIQLKDGSDASTVLRNRGRLAETLDMSGVEKLVLYAGDRHYWSGVANQEGTLSRLTQIINGY